MSLVIRVTSVVAGFVGRLFGVAMSAFHEGRSQGRFDYRYLSTKD